MPMLNVAGFGDVTVIEGGADKNVELIGDHEDAYAGQARSDTSGTKRVWRFTTSFLTLAQATSLETVLHTVIGFDVSGDFIGGTIPCHGRNVRTVYGPGPDDATLSFQLREIGIS